MTDINTIIKTCDQSTNIVRTIVFYSHLIPVSLSLILGFFVFFKAKFNLFSRVFLIFIIAFSIWLISDVLAWNSNNFYLIYTTWSFLVYIEIIFYVLGIYFAIISFKKTDISNMSKIFLFLLTIPPFIITIMGHSVTGFSQPLCEASNNNFLDIYKLVTEIILLLILLFYILKSLIQKNSFKKNKANLIVLGSMFLFLAIFGITEYVSAITGIYEYNLYSLFLLPVFLLVIIYGVFELDIFHFNILGTQYLVVGLVILITGQLFFVNGGTDRLLTIITVIISVALSIILFRNLKRESDQRIHIEKLSIELEQSKTRLEDFNLKLETANDKLKSLDRLKTEFVSLASHQLRSPLTAIKGYTSMLLEGDYGEINKEARETIERVMESSNNLTIVVEDLLNISKIESGGMKYEMIEFDLGEIIRHISKELSITAESKGLKLICNTSDKDTYFINGDKDKIRQVIINLIDNSMKYTPKGEIAIGIKKEENKIILSIKDTGVGVDSEAKKNIFEKFSRGDGAKLNASGSGLGLYLVKEIVKAHKGRVWVDSEGLGKGSTFFVEFNSI